jgi:hypothetical protein
MALKLAIISALVGIALGLGYDVVILIGAVALAMMFALPVEIAHGDHFWSIALSIAISGSTIQLGYLAGVLIGAIIE